MVAVELDPREYKRGRLENENSQGKIIQMIKRNISADEGCSHIHCLSQVGTHIKDTMFTLQQRYKKDIDTGFYSMGSG